MRKMLTGVTNIAIAPMYLELSRAMVSAEIKAPLSMGEEDAPDLVMVNLQFIRQAAAVIFCVSALEAYVNILLGDILKDRFKILDHVTEEEKAKLIGQRVKELKQRYSTAQDREILFLKKDLIEKVNLAFYTLGKTRLTESGKREDRILHRELGKLQKIRNELIHAKPHIIEESEEIRDFFNLGFEELEQKIKIVPAIILRLHEGLPVLNIGATGNVIIERLVFDYKGDAVGEHLLLTGTEYSHDNVKKFGMRWKS